MSKRVNMPMKRSAQQSNLHSELEVDSPAELNEDATGALLCAVAKLKGISDEAISIAINVPQGTTQAYFEGRNVGYRDDIRQALAKYLGVDLATHRLSSQQVHVFMLNKISLKTTRKQFNIYMHAVGRLLRVSKSATLEFPCLGLAERFSLRVRGVHVVQSKNTRAIFLGGQCLTFRARFSPAFVESCIWAGGTKENSIFSVAQLTLGQRIVKNDITTAEFDEIFRGSKATTWRDVDMSARVNGVTKDEVVEWIETIGARRALEATKSCAITLDVTAERWNRIQGSEPTGIQRARAASGSR